MDQLSHTIPYKPHVLYFREGCYDNLNKGLGRQGVFVSNCSVSSLYVCLVSCVGKRTSLAAFYT